MFGRGVRTSLIYTPSHRERPKENFGSSDTLTSVNTAHRTREHRPRLRMFLPANDAPHRDAVDVAKLRRRGQASKGNFRVSELHENVPIETR